MELLKKLYCIHSKSRKESDLIEFLLNWMFENIPDANVELDDSCNVYVTRGTSETYPCIVAHLDQVQTLHSDDFQAIETEDIIFGWSSKNKRHEGLGADDKNGVWIALQCLLRYDVMKVALFIGEEIGCVGSDKADMSFFENCRYVLQCDRRGFDDFITQASCTELCSKEFADAVDYKMFGYVEGYGLMTDVMTLKQNGLKVSCCNMSCGYYKPHTDDEFTIKYDLLNCLHLVEYIVENLTDVYPHEYVYKPYTSNYPYGRSDAWDDGIGGYGGYGSYGYGYGGYNNQQKQIGFKPSVSNTQAKTNGVAQETSQEVADNNVEHQIQKFFDTETVEDDFPNYGLDDNFEIDELSDELSDEIYDMIYALICDCPNASYDMIRSAIMQHYHNVCDRDLYGLYNAVI